MYARAVVRFARRARCTIVGASAPRDRTFDFIRARGPVSKRSDPPIIVRRPNHTSGPPDTDPHYAPDGWATRGRAPTKRRSRTVPKIDNDNRTRQERDVTSAELRSPFLSSCRVS